MKKILKLLVLLVLFVPFVAMADMGMPELTPVKVTIASADGVNYYDWDYKEVKGRLKDGEVLYLVYEEVSNNKIVYHLAKNKDSGADYYVCGDDTKKVVPVEKDYNPADHSEFVKDNSELKTYLDVKMYKGPSTAFEIVTTIPSGTIVTASYTDGYYYYVDYNGQKGFVNVLNEGIMVKGYAEILLFYDKETSCGTIPAGTILTSEFHNVVNQFLNWQVNYKGCYTFVNGFKAEDLAVYHKSDSRKYVAGKNIDIYEKAGNKGNKVATIKKGEKFSVHADDEDYEEPQLYVTYDGKAGFVKTSYENYKKADDYKEEEDVPTTTEATTNASGEETTTQAEQKGETENKKQFDTKTIIIACVIVGLSVAIIAIVVIVLLNKGGKKNVSAPVETQPTTEEVKVEEAPATEETNIDTTNNN